MKKSFFCLYNYKMLTFTTHKKTLEGFQRDNPGAAVFGEGIGAGRKGGRGERREEKKGQEKGRAWKEAGRKRESGREELLPAQAPPATRDKQRRPPPPSEIEQRLGGERVPGIKHGPGFWVLTFQHTMLPFASADMQVESEVGKGEKVEN